MKKDLIDTIKNGRIKMRPRSYFITRSVVALIGTIVVFFVILFMITFIVFALQENGGSFATHFGFAGWGIFLESLPWSMLFLSLALALILWILLRRYAIVYRQPFLYVLLALAIVTSLASAFISESAIQGEIFHYAFQNHIPVVSGVYELETAPANDIYRGHVAVLATSSFILTDETGHTSTILLIPAAMERFSMLGRGDYVVIFGHSVATATISASGVTKIVDYQ